MMNSRASLRASSNPSGRETRENAGGRKHSPWDPSNFNWLRGGFRPKLAQLGRLSGVPASVVNARHLDKHLERLDGPTPRVGHILHNHAFHPNTPRHANLMARSRE